MMLCFTCNERKNWSNIKKSQNTMATLVCKFLFCFLSLAITPNLKKGYILAEKGLIFLEKCHRPNFKVFQNQIWMDLNKKFKKVDIKHKNVQKETTDWSFKESGAGYNQNTVLKENYGHNIWHSLAFMQ